MDSYERTVMVGENRIINYTISDGYVPMHTIREDFIEKGKIIKNYKLCRWDDYGFTGWINNDANNQESINLVSYKFDINHPFYIPLLHLLQGDEHLIIDDDQTQELNKKYMMITKEEDNIVITFANNLESNSTINRFYVFIKNIGPDARSKIDCFYKDTKERLDSFFKEIYELVTEEYHQITIEEYLLKKSKSY